MKRTSLFILLGMIILLGGNKAPTQDIPQINLDEPLFETQSAIGYNISTFDPDGDAVFNNFVWSYNTSGGITDPDYLLYVSFNQNNITDFPLIDYSNRSTNITISGCGQLTNWINDSTGTYGPYYNWTSDLNVPCVDDISVGINVPTATFLDLSGGNWTIEGWFRYAGGNGNATLISKEYYAVEEDPGFGDRPIRGWALRTGGSHLDFHLNCSNTGSSSDLSSSANSVINNTWQHYAVTRNDTGFALWVDGNLSATNTVVCNSYATPIDLMIGAHQAGTGGLKNHALGWRGDLDEVRIYNRTLNSTEIIDHNATRYDIFRTETLAAGTNVTLTIYPNDYNLTGNIASISTLILAAPINLNSCTTITTSGYYFINKTLTAPAGRSCLNITVSDVTVDGRGFLMTGNNAAGTAGVNVSGKFLTNITIKNFPAITGFNYGFNLMNIKGVILQNNTVKAEIASRNLWGINTTNVTFLQVLKSSFNGLRTAGASTLVGIDLTRVNNSIISGNTLSNLSGTTVYGIRITGANNLTIDSAVITNFKGVTGTASTTFAGILSSSIAGLQPTNLTIRNSTIFNFNSQLGSAVGGAACDSRGINLNSNAGQGNLSIISTIVHNITACGEGSTPTDGLSYGIIVNNALNSTFRNLNIYNISSEDAGGGAATAYGFYCSSCADSNATRVNINNIGGTSGLIYGFDIFGSARFSFLQLNVSRADPALYVESSSADVLLTNSSLTSNLPSANDISFTAGSHRLTAINSTFNRSKITYANAQNLSIKWYMQVNVTNSSGTYLDGARVNITNATSVNPQTINALVTNGFTVWFTLTDFFGNSSENTSYNQYNFSAINTSYNLNWTGINISNSTIVRITLYKTSVVPDTTKPMVFLIEPLNQTYNRTNNLPLKFNASDDVALSVCWYNLNAGANTTISCTVNTTFGSGGSGNFNLTLWANDTSNNVNSSSVWFNVDLTKPTPMIDHPRNTTLGSKTFSFNFTVTDNQAVAQCWYSLAGAANVTLSGCLNATLTVLTDGQYNLTLFANDTAGNLNQSDVRLFTIDTTPPTITIWEPLNQTYNQTNATVPINTTFSETINVSWYQLNRSGVNISFVGRTDITAGNGTDYLQVWANDTVNNWGYAEVYFSINLTSPLVAPTPSANNTKLLREPWFRNMIEVEDCFYPIPLSWLFCRGG